MSRPAPTGTPRASPRASLAHRIAVARGDRPADLVLKGGSILSVFTGELMRADVAIAGEHVAALGPGYDGDRVVDVAGSVLLPGFIDGHMHLESTKLMVDEFARVAMPWGTTTVVLDPHEIANVFGLEGVRAILANAQEIPLDVYVMVSSCVPASPFESSGATVTAEEIARFLDEEPNAIGLAEMMDVHGAVQGSEEVIGKLVAASGLHIDGHAPGLTGRALNAYVAAGIRSDHECTTYEEALEKRRLGMSIMLREGSAARNLEALLPLVLRFGPANCLLCADDREPDHLIDEGHINDVVRKAVRLGCPPSDAVAMATINAARYHRLPEHGALAPGYLADVVAVDDLERFRPERVWKRGRLVAERGVPVEIPRVRPPDALRDSVRIHPVSGKDLAVRADGRIRVIGIDAGTIVTRQLTEEPTRRGETVVADPHRDLAKIAVVERHRGLAAWVSASSAASAFGAGRSRRRTPTTPTTSWSSGWTTTIWPWPSDGWPRPEADRSPSPTGACWRSCAVRSAGCSRTIRPRRLRPRCAPSRTRRARWASPCPRRSWPCRSWRCR